VFYKENQDEKNLSFQKKTLGIFTKKSTYLRYFTKKSSKNINFISFRDQKFLRESQIWGFLKKYDLHTKMEDNFSEDNCKLAKTHETQGILEKAQGILDKTQGFLNSRLSGGTF